MTGDHKKIIAAFAADRPLAHSILFKHALPDAPFHGPMIKLWHSRKEKVVFDAFRHAAKSTRGEEAMAILACLCDFKNGLIIGANEPKALERLHAVKHELEHNENIKEVFGEQRGDVWAGRQATLANGTHMQALGAHQSVRGTKYNRFRPDFLWIDDIEDEDSVLTSDACKARLEWLYGTLIPVCARFSIRIRMTGNNLASDSVVAKASQDPAWHAMRIPVLYRDLETGEEKASWPDCFDMEWIRQKRDEYDRLAMIDVWNREYMCEVAVQTRKPFSADHYKLYPQARRPFHMVNAMWDPARSQSSKAAATGKAVWSWIGSKLVVWDGFAKVGMLPSELIDDIFQTDTDFKPAGLYVEKNGLEEWLDQPLRLEQQTRRHLLPQLESVRAPRDKDNFIRSLQPYLASGDIEFAQELPAFRSQIAQYPSGRNDALNALAYAFLLRPGLPVYEDFDQDHIALELYPTSEKKTLVLGSDGRFVVAALIQYTGAFEVIWDFVDEGDPAVLVLPIINRAKIAAKSDIEVILPRAEFDAWTNHGLSAACHRAIVRPGMGAPIDKGREYLRNIMRERHRGLASFLIDQNSRWTIQALSGGYHFPVERGGQTAAEPERGIYRILMEAVESFAGLMQNVARNDHDDRFVHTSTTRDGRSYRSTIHGKRG